MTTLELLMLEVKLNGKLDKRLKTLGNIERHSVHMKPIKGEIRRSLERKKIYKEEVG